MWDSVYFSIRLFSYVLFHYGIASMLYGLGTSHYSFKIVFTTVGLVLRRALNQSHRQGRATKRLVTKIECAFTEESIPRFPWTTELVGANKIKIKRYVVGSTGVEGIK